MILDEILDYFFPRKCLGCEEEEGYLCAWCEGKISLLKNQCCPNCRKVNDDGKFCSPCAGSFHFDQLLVCLEYSKSNLISKMIVQFKYKFSEELVGILGRIMKHQLANFSHSLRDDGEVFVIPVPLSRERLRYRGFNQARVLAEYLVKSFSRMCLCDCLERETGNLQQAGQSKEARLGNLQQKIHLKEFLLKNSKFLKNKTVILVDDIATTGATLNECAKVLKDHGARHVCGLVLARGKLGKTQLIC